MAGMHSHKWDGGTTAASRATRRNIAVAIPLAFNKRLQQHMRPTTLRDHDMATHTGRAATAVQSRCASSLAARRVSKTQLPPGTATKPPQLAPGTATDKARWKWVVNVLEACALGVHTDVCKEQNSKVDVYDLQLPGEHGKITSASNLVWPDMPHWVRRAWRSMAWKVSRTRNTMASTDPRVSSCHHHQSLSTHDNFGPLCVETVYRRTRAACKVYTFS